MNMKKLLATGLIASVAVASTESSASCGNGGFYIQGGFGLSLTKMKYKNNLEPQHNVLIQEEIGAMPMYQLKSAGNQAIMIVYKAQDIYSSQAHMDADKTSVGKSKGLFQFDFGFGVDKRFGQAVFAITFSFGKNFGNIKKKEKGMAMHANYIPSSIIEVGNNRFAPLSPQNCTQACDLNRTEIFQRGPGGYVVNPELTDAEQLFSKDYIDNLLTRCYSRDLELELKCKNKFYIGIMPRVGVLLTPELELFVTAGFKIKSDKYTITATALKKSEKKTVTKCIPSFGLGLQYNFQGGMFANLAYNFNLKAKKTFKLKTNNKLGLDSTVKHTLQNSSHDFKLGIGYRF